MSDKHDTASEALHAHGYITADDRERVAHVLRQAYAEAPVPSLQVGVDAPGEDEVFARAVTFFDQLSHSGQMIQVDGTEYLGIILADRATRFAAALRSRLASADSIAEAIVAHGYGSADDVRRIAHLIRAALEGADKIRLAEPVLSDGRTADQALHDEYAEPSAPAPDTTELREALGSGIIDDALMYAARLRDEAELPDSPERKETLHKRANEIMDRAAHARALLRYEPREENQS